MRRSHGEVCLLQILRPQCERNAPSLHVGRLGGGVLCGTGAAHSRASHLRAHLGGHHATLGGGSWTRVVVLEGTLELDALDVLLVLDLLLEIWIDFKVSTFFTS